MKKITLILFLINTLLFSSNFTYEGFPHILSIKDKDKKECVEGLLKDKLNNENCSFYSMGPTNWELKEQLENYSIICYDNFKECFLISNKNIKILNKKEE